VSFVYVFSSVWKNIPETAEFWDLFFAFLGGVGLDYIFPPFTEKIKTWELFREIMGQSLLLILTVFGIRYVVKGIPIAFPYPSGRNYVPYQTAEFNGEMMMGFVFLGSQLNLIRKIDLLADRLYRLYFKEEKIIKYDVERDVTILENGVKKEVKIIEKDMAKKL
jgi:hypothetical protein